MTPWHCRFDSTRPRGPGLRAEPRPRGECAPGARLRGSGEGRGSAGRWGGKEGVCVGGGRRCGSLSREEKRGLLALHAHCFNQTGAA